MLVYNNWAIKQPASTPATSGGITHASNTEPIREFLEKYINVFVSSQGHGLCVHVWTLVSESRMDYLSLRQVYDVTLRSAVSWFPVPVMMAGRLLKV